MARCEQVYPPQKGCNATYCRLTGQPCLVDSLDGDQCLRRIWWDKRILQAQGLAGGAGTVVKMNKAPKGAAVQVVLL